MERTETIGELVGGRSIEINRSEEIGSGSFGTVYRSTDTPSAILVPTTGGGFTPAQITITVGRTGTMAIQDETEERELAYMLSAFEELDRVADRLIVTMDHNHDLIRETVGEIRSARILLERIK